MQQYSLVAVTAVRVRWAWLAVVILAAVVGALLASGTDTHRAKALTVQDLPLQAQAQISRSMARHSAQYDAMRAGRDFAFTGGGMATTVAPTGTASIKTAAGPVSLAVAGIGRGAQVNPLKLTGSSAHGNRVTIGDGNVREWFAAGPLGVEHGFDIAGRPAGGTGPLTVALEVGGPLTPFLDEQDVQLQDARGEVVARYGGLTAIDRNGKHLPARVTVQGRRVSLIVTDDHAAYPVRIDPLIQQAKLTPPGRTDGSSQFGQSSAVSADGSTAIFGGPLDAGVSGAAWVYTRSGTTWTEQQRIVAPSDAADSSSRFGDSVALSADGTIALIGGDYDNGGAGAAWVYTRTAGTWTEQQKIPTPADHLGSNTQFGHSVALSADGTTALIGGIGDGARTGAGVGAAWVYTRTAGIWSEQQKIAADATSGLAYFGYSVALSADGGTALIGGPYDNGAGAAWVYTRTAATWTEQQKLPAPADADSSYPQFGYSVALSADGTTALIGGSYDNDGLGAAWVYASTAGTWTKQQKITGPADADGSYPQFGYSVALSADGTTALIGGAYDNGALGTAWVYTSTAGAWTEQQKIPAPADADTGAGYLRFGCSVALSADGTNALVGGIGDNNNAGAAWVYSRAGVAWSQQAKIVAPDERTQENFGLRTAISGDGSTVLISSAANNGNAGAVYTYTRSGTAWIEQQKITAPDDAIGTTTYFGFSVALSADGTTALIGALGDNAFAGAAWVYTRTGATWNKQQKIPAPADAIGTTTFFGFSVALSADGSTALIGGINDNQAGAAWVYTRTASTWTKQQKIPAPAPADADSSYPQFGSSVALSADGTTALIAGINDNNQAGAAWVYTRTASTWTEQQKIPAPIDAIGDNPNFGISVALSADGDTALIGGLLDDTRGAAWVYTRTASTWTEQHKIPAPADAIGSYTYFGNSVALSADGTTALIGSPNASDGVGAAWVYTRTGTSWNKQQKIAPTDGAGPSSFGVGVSLSSNGVLAVIGGAGDADAVGAAWTYASDVLTALTVDGARARLLRGGGVQIRWRAAARSQVLGYDVLRVTPHRRARINRRGMIDGLALRGDLGGHFALTDRGGRRGDRYIVRVRFINGKQMTLSPVVASGRRVRPVRESASRIR